METLKVGTSPKTSIWKCIPWRKHHKGTLEQDFENSTALNSTNIGLHLGESMSSAQFITCKSENAVGAGEESPVLPIKQGNIIQKAGIPPSSSAYVVKNGSGHHETVEALFSLWSWPC